MRFVLCSPLLGLLGALASPSARAAPDPPLWSELKRPGVAAVAGLPAFARLARGAGAAVVNISVVQADRAAPPAAAAAGPGRRALTRSQGTGFLIHRDGYILTNHHVIENADEIRVRLVDDREFAGQVVGSDERTDVALLKIEVAGEIAVAPLGDSDHIEIGEWVMAIGNPFGLDHTVTVGIISGKGRRDVRPGGMAAGFFDFIQTDASINVGNSGGPLINLRGEVIGVNTAINAQGQGIAFAIPINMVKAILPMLRQRGHVARSWLGATLQSLTAQLARSFQLADTRGALVAQVTAGSPADRCGLAPGDVVVELDGHPIRRADDLTWQVSTAGAGQRVVLTVRHGAATRKVSTLLVADPDAHNPPPTIPERPRATPLGIMVSEVPASRPEARLGGVVVLQVEPGSPASEAGIERGDVLLRIGDGPVSGLEDYRRAVINLPRGALIRVLANRDGKSFWAAFAKR